MSEKNFSPWDKLAVAFEVKAVAAEGSTGTFEGVASVYGNVDRQGDVVMKGAFTKSLQEDGDEVPLLWQHQMDEPIGVVKLTDSPKGLLANGQIDLDIPEGKRAHSALQKRYVKGLSIGYDTIRDSYSKAVRQLDEVKLWELSVVTFPANPLATITSAKAVATMARLGVLDRMDVLARELKTLDSAIAAEIKAGRVLSKVNLQHVQDAMGHLNAMAESHKACMEHMKSLLDAGSPPGDPDPDDPQNPNVKAVFDAFAALSTSIKAVQPAAA